MEEPYTKNKEGKLVNIVEYIVRQKVDEQIKTMDMCQCDICKNNACAIALNNLPPHYVTTELGELLAKLEDEVLNYYNYNANVLVEVTKALLIVKDHPRH